jgi:hypothetical protein
MKDRQGRYLTSSPSDYLNSKVDPDGLIKDSASCADYVSFGESNTVYKLLAKLIADIINSEDNEMKRNTNHLPKPTELVDDT